ncbi:MAG TPA: hypothetical protein VMT89_06615, partial [Candidatus Acidoferrales bacterium]|nr:hypothetical protein [Candidatus Acidoferrales bacterium]
PQRAAAYNCGERQFQPISVALSNPVAGALSTYSIVTKVPDLPGCDLSRFTEITITFPDDTDAGTITSGLLNGNHFAFQPMGNAVTLIAPIPVDYDAPLIISLLKVTNPVKSGVKTLTMVGRNVLNGGIGTTTSQLYSVTAPNTTPTPTFGGPTLTFTPGTPTASPTPGRAPCGGVLTAPNNCCNGNVDPDEECDDGGACFGGANAGHACGDNSQCPGGECHGFGGDGCAANCTAEIALHFEFTGARCFGGSKDGMSCTGLRFCAGGAFPGKPCRLPADCGPANNRGACASECTTAGDGSDCAGVGACTAGDAGKIGSLCPSRLSGNLANSTLGTCQGGPRPGIPCASDSTCGDGACQNPCSPGGSGGVCRHRSTMTAESLGMVSELAVGPAMGAMDLYIGKHDIDGLVPVAVPANSVSFAPIRIPGLGCACVDGVAEPAIHGPGNAASGIIGCGVGGLPNANVDISIDHNTKPRDSRNGEGACNGGPRDGLACGADSDCSGVGCVGRGRGGGVCVAGTNAMHLCHTDAECPGSICISPDDSTCSADDPPIPDGSGSSACLETKEVCFGGSNAGTACSSNSNCRGGGTCGTACNPTSLHPNTCNGPERLSFSGAALPPGASILVGSLQTYLIASPDDDGSCRKASVCLPLTFNQSSPPAPCQIDAECASGQKCRPNYCAGVCLGGANLRQPCIRDSQCGAGGFCGYGETFGRPCTGLPDDCLGGVCQPVDAAKGFDGQPCTADDVRTAGGSVFTIPLTTGMASAGVTDANDFDSAGSGLMFGGVCTGRSQCLTSVQGQPFDCSLLASSMPAVTGATFVSAYPQLDAPIIGDVVYTRKLTAK